MQRIMRLVMIMAGVVGIFEGCACTRIEPGHVGIEIHLAGDQRGVSDIPTQTGWIFYAPWSTDVMEYPTFVQTAVWTKNPEEGSPTNEEVSFNTKDGLVMTGDVSLSYRLDQAKVPQFYVKFRSDDLTTFTHGFLRNVARDAFNEVAGQYAVEDIYGAKKEEFLKEVRKRLVAGVEDVGVNIEQFGFIGAPRPPESVIKAIDAKSAATQLAMQAENELRRTEAEAKKIIAKAEGDAQAKVKTAEGEARANAILAKSISPALLEWRRLDLQHAAVAKWDGRRPTVEGAGSGLLLQVSTDGDGAK